MIWTRLKQWWKTRKTPVRQCGECRYFIPPQEGDWGLRPCTHIDGRGMVYHGDRACRHFNAKEVENSA